jgi:hypothetical protein
MCVVAVKYLDKYGWVGAKNRDRNYVVGINIVKSNRDDIQRLYIDDLTTRWTEGINEYGLSILSASFSVKSDEKEGDKVKKKKGKTPIVSPDGLSIRNALKLKDPEAAANFLVKRQLSGATYVFNEKRCFLIEGGFNTTKAKASDDNPRKFTYKIIEISKEDNHSVRTNHGVVLPQFGYAKNGKSAAEKRNRKSSESRRNIVEELFDSSDVKRPDQVLDCLSAKPEDDSFMNPIRIGDPKKGDMVTTGQLLIVPHEKTLHYRPIYSSVFFDYPKINSDVDSKVYFEIISSRRLLAFRDFSK